MPRSAIGVRRLLSWPRAYEFLQRAVGSDTSHRRFISEHVRPTSDTSLLDIGCGPGHILRSLPGGIHYVGIDSSAAYISAARREWGTCGEFLCTTADEADLADRRFEIVLAMGLLHHLDDAACASLFGLAARVLDPDGRFLAIDPAWVPGQRRAARWLIARDRGEYVRAPDAYAGLARPWFQSVAVITHNDLLRVPYTHAVLEGLRPTQPEAEKASTATAHN